MRNFSDKNIKKFQFPFEVNSFCYNSGSNFTRLAHIKLFQFPFEVYCFWYMIDVMKEYMIDIKFQFLFEVSCLCYLCYGMMIVFVINNGVRFQFPFEVYCFWYMIDVMKEYMIDIKFQFLFEVSCLCYTDAGTVVFCVVCCKFQLSFEVYCFWYNRRNPLDRLVYGYFNFFSRFTLFSTLRNLLPRSLLTVMTYFNSLPRFTPFSTRRLQSWGFDWFDYGISIPLRGFLLLLLQHHGIQQTNTG